VAFFQLSGGSTGTPKLIPRTHNDYDYSIRRSNEICGIR
jgi:2,3-dihydroxybenzoate-AMP ligase